MSLRRAMLATLIAAAGCGDSGTDGGSDDIATGVKDMTMKAGKDMAVPPGADMAVNSDDMAMDDLAMDDMASDDIGPSDDMGGCAMDADCMDPALPRCVSGSCKACAAMNDNCPSGQFCDEGNGNVCAQGCKGDPDCQGDGGTGSCCAHVCTDTTSDNQNCSACGMACAKGQGCCSSACSDTTGDVNNCGGCGKVCGGANAMAACAMSTCSITCNMGFADCNLSAQDGCESDLSKDGMNCGKCGTACPTGPNADGACANSACTFACKPGFGDCNKDPKDGCETDLTKDANCGACGTVCGAVANGTSACMAGACVATCAKGFGDCNKDPKDGCESNFAADAANCGGCGSACMAIPNGTLACQAGKCAGEQCSKGFGDCNNDPADGCETDTTTMKNCGGCGIACGAVANGTPGCIAGACGVGMCNANFGDCDGKGANGCETDLTASAANCGKCGGACPVGPHQDGTCVKSVCGLACSAGYADCNKDPMDGCEVNTDGDVNNCGGCGMVCGVVANGSAACVKGKCVVGGCSKGFDDCDKDPKNGCESNLGSDVKNCGACGTACAGAACGTVVASDFATLPALWTFNGNATYDANVKSGVLTAAAGNQVGTIIYKDAITVDTFDVAFDFRINGGSGADGMAFMLETDGPNAVGGAGGGLGITGLHGYGVEFDTYNNGACGDTTNGHVGIDSLTACNGALPTSLYVNPVSPVALRGANFHSVVIHVEGGQFNVTIDGQVAISLQQIPNFAAGKPYFFGFGGATGGLTDRQEVRNVKMTFPTTRCL